MLPFGRRVGAEGIRHGAPAGVFHQQGFFGAGCRAAFGFDALQGADGFDIVESLVAEAAFANPVRIRYSEIAGWDGICLGLGLPDDGRSRGGWFRLVWAGWSSPGRNAHSFIASSQAAW